MILYLAYGSNLLPARIEARLGPVEILGTAPLPNWHLVHHKYGADGSGKCDLIKRDGALAYGAIYGIEPQKKSLLDEIEGVGNGYRNIEYTLETFGTVTFYIAETSHVDAELIPYDWYREFVLRGAVHHAFPSAYLDAIQRWPTIPDADENRRRENFAIANARVIKKGG